jgi:SARP family transcriptional regulator, regulator of embCAB operon
MIHSARTPAAGFGPRHEDGPKRQSTGWRSISPGAGLASVYPRENRRAWNQPGKGTGGTMEQDRNGGQLRLQLFGAWRLLRGPMPIRTGRRQQRLIAALAILGACNRSYLAGLLWPTSTEGQAQASLRVGIHLASTQVPDLLVCEGATLYLSAEVDVDLHRIRRIVTAADRGELDGLAATYLADLQAGELLPGWYEDFVVEEQDRLQAARLRCYRSIASESLVHGLIPVAIQAARAALAIDPCDDFSAAQLIRAELLQGNQAGALRIYHDHAAILRRDLDIGPPLELAALVADLLHGAPNPPPGPGRG